MTFNDPQQMITADSKVNPQSRYKQLLLEGHTITAKQICYRMTFKVIIMTK